MLTVEDIFLRTFIDYLRKPWLKCNISNGISMCYVYDQMIIFSMVHNSINNRPIFGNEQLCTWMC